MVEERDSKGMNKKRIPVYPIWKIMRIFTKRQISNKAVIEMERHITYVIESATKRADAILTDLNNRLPGDMHRNRITAENISEALEHVL